MANAAKSIKSKVTTSFRVDPDLLDKARRKCHQESIDTNKKVTLTLKFEEFLRNWVEKK
jgi:hypothetical protein